MRLTRKGKPDKRFVTKEPAKNFDNKGLPTSRKEAEKLGSKFYITGRPCKRNHISERHTKGGSCCECVRYMKSNNPNDRQRSIANVKLTAEALAKGKTTYIPNTPCKYDHLLRFTASNNCVKCNELMRKKHKITQKFNRIKKTYGLTKSQYINLVESQNSSCKICDKNEKDHFKLHIDHCHNTNKVRGLLCSCCNQAIGLLKHSPKLLRNAAEYCIT